MRQRLLRSLAREQARLLAIPVILSILSPVFMIGLTYITDRSHLLERDVAVARDPVLLCLLVALLFITQPYAIFETLAGALPQRWHRMPLPTWKIASIHLSARLAATFAAYYGSWLVFSMFYQLPHELLHPLVPLFLYGVTQSLMWSWRRPVLLMAGLALHADFLLAPHGPFEANPAYNVLDHALACLQQWRSPEWLASGERWSGGSWPWLIALTLGYVAAIFILNMAALRLDRKGAGLLGALRRSWGGLSARRARTGRTARRKMTFHQFHDPYHAQYWFEIRFRRRLVLLFTLLFVAMSAISLAAPRLMNAFGMTKALFHVVVPVWLACIAFAGLRRRQAIQQTVFLAVRPADTTAFAQARLRALYTTWFLATLVAFACMLAFYMISPLFDWFPLRSLVVAWGLLFCDPAFLTELLLFFLAALYLNALAFGVAAVLSSGAPLEAVPSPWRARVTWAAPFLVVLLTILLMTSVQFERIIPEVGWGGLLFYEAAGALLITHIRVVRFARRRGLAGPGFGKTGPLGNNGLLWNWTLALVPALAALTAFVAGWLVYFAGGFGFENYAEAVFVVALAPLALYPALGELLHVQRSLRPGLASDNASPAPDVPRFSRRVMVLSHVLGTAPLACLALAFVYSSSDSYLHAHGIATSLAEFARQHNWVEEPNPYAGLCQDAHRLSRSLQNNEFEHAPFVGRLENDVQRWASKPLPPESVAAMDAYVDANEKVFAELDRVCMGPAELKWAAGRREPAPEYYSKLYFVLNRDDSGCLGSFENMNLMRMLWGAVHGDETAVGDAMRDLRVVALDNSHSVSPYWHRGFDWREVDMICFAADQVLRRGTLSEKTLEALQKECRLFEEQLLGPRGSQTLIEQELFDVASVFDREKRMMEEDRNALGPDRSYWIMRRLMDLGMPEAVRTVSLVDMKRIMTLPFPASVQAEREYRGEYHGRRRYESWDYSGYYLSAEHPAERICELRLTRIKMALARYRLAHGAYPDTLAAVAPEFLEQIPQDPLTGQPFQYRKTVQGFWLAPPKDANLPWSFYRNFDELDHFFPIHQP